ncbi:TPA: hypothetical protein N0F65_005045 [Lagenidium giganteum]|uniref:Endonuclease/exonuclease/phosphatase domain-containing protein n=1 Tax=Lagenidium giganteum TaxID=4803 RepID=A0AAV2ZRF5_9STRA|nr:TPA: hypothetical protein N0F65_005045 [Lagenidium giganteum]
MIKHGIDQHFAPVTETEATRARATAFGSSMTQFKLPTTATTTLKNQPVGFDRGNTGYPKTEPRKAPPCSFWSTGSTASGGVAILAAPHSTLTNIQPFHEDNWTTHWMAVTARQDSDTIVIVCCYGPQDHHEREQLYATIRNELTGNTRIYIGGDFNCTQSPADRRHLEATQTRISKLALLTTTLDIYGHCEGGPGSRNDQHTYRYTTASGQARSSRLDRWYLTAPGEQWKVEVHTTIPGLPADHDGAILTLTDVSRAPRARPEPKLYHSDGRISKHQTEDAQAFMLQAQEQMDIAVDDTASIEIWERIKTDLQALLLRSKQNARAKMTTNYRNRMRAMLKELRCLETAQWKTAC